MPLDTLTPPTDPNAGSVVEFDARTKSADFGDGYSQRAVDGLNPIRRTLALEWPKLTKAQAAVLVDFFAAKAGVTAFLYQPPKESAALKWTCAKWRRSSTGNTNAAVSATFVQVNDL